MKTKKTDLYTIVEVAAMVGYKFKDKHRHILKSNPPKTGQAILPGNACNT